MDSEQLIPANELCTYYNLEYSFIRSLQDSGLIEVTTIEEQGFIHPGQLQQLEKFARLHYDLDINLPGIEAIAHLLERVSTMQHEMAMLRNRLRLYERIGG